MVALLRASGGNATEMTPQPTLADLRTRASPRRGSLPGSQQGLVGLRERADILGGTLYAGPTVEGGYRVRLRIPLSTA